MGKKCFPVVESQIARVARVQSHKAWRSARRHGKGDGLASECALRRGCMCNSLPCAFAGWREAHAPPALLRVGLMQVVKRRRFRLFAIWRGERHAQVDLVRVVWVFCFNAEMDCQLQHAQARHGLRRRAQCECFIAIECACSHAGAALRQAGCGGGWRCDGLRRGRSTCHQHSDTEHKQQPRANGVHHINRSSQASRRPHAAHLRGSL